MARKNKTLNPGYTPGNYWLICDRTGLPMRLSDARQEWNGLVVHKDEYETRHPQDLLRTRRTEQGPHSFTRPRPEAVYGAPTCFGRKNAQAGIAVVGCAVAGWVVTDGDTTVPTGTFTNSL